jgi:hypothetical protein
MSVATTVEGRVGAWIAWAWRPLLIAGLSRVLSSVLVLAFNEQRRNPAGNPFALWDGQWYLGIARDGYHGDPLRFHPEFGQAWHDFAFFPGWPATMKAGWLLASPFDVRIATVAAVLAPVLFVAGAVVAWRVMADRLGPRAATTGLALLAFSPPAYAFSLIYSESLFLVLGAASFLAAGRLARPILVGLAMLTRIAGAALVLSALVEAVRSRGRRRREALAAAAGGIVAFGVWVAAVAWLTRDPLGYMRGSAAWNMDSGVVPQLARAITQPSWEQAGWIGFTLVAAVGAVLLVRRDTELGVYSLGCLALILLPGGVAHSWARYVLAAFPVFAILGQRVQDRFGRAGIVGLLVLFAIGQVVFAGWTISSTRISP